MVWMLCLNAGIMAFDDDRTGDGFDVQMQTNQLSHFLLTSLVYSSLQNASEKRGEARIVPHSSSAREMVKSLDSKYFEKCEPNTLGGNSAWVVSQMVLGRGGPWVRYGQTKLANSIYAMALHNKLSEADSKIKAVCCEPGYSATPLQNTKHMINMMERLVPRQSAADGALNAIMACFNKETKSGDLFAPEKKMTGKPIKVVAGGLRQNTGIIGGTDKSTCDPSSRNYYGKHVRKHVVLNLLLVKND